MNLTRLSVALLALVALALPARGLGDETIGTMPTRHAVARGFAPGDTLTVDVPGFPAVEVRGIDEGQENATAAPAGQFTYSWQYRRGTMTVTASQGPGESDDAFAARCSNKIRAMLNQFPPDGGPHTGALLRLDSDKTAWLQGSTQYCCRARAA